MHRRNILWGARSAFGAAFAVSRAGAATETAPAAKLKVVYHLNDLDKVSFVTSNIQNHLDGLGGPDHVPIALVVSWPGVAGVSFGFRQPRSFEARRAIRQSRSRTRHLQQHHEIAECHAEGFIAGLHSRRPRRGADRRTAIARLSLSAALNLSIDVNNPPRSLI